MAPDHKSNPNKKRKNYLPQYKPVKKGSYPLRPGVEGFFITCDGGREHQAANEAINVIESFYEELVDDDDAELRVEHTELPKKPSNKIIKFASDSSGSDNDDDDDDKDADKVDAKDINNLETGEDNDQNAVASTDNGNDELRLETENVVPSENQALTEEKKPEKQDIKESETPENQDNKEAEALGPPAKRQCTDADAANNGTLSKKVETKSVDKLIEAELAELGDKSKRRFCKLDTGCNGVIFIQMRKREGDPSTKDIVHRMMTSLAVTKKHVSRFLLRLLPVEVSCYPSDEEIRRAIKPVIEKYFPVETEKPRKFSVLYDARANTGINRAKVIDAVAKCVPSIHKVDLANPDISIMVQIVKTVCLIGVVEKYKEFAKYNLRQLSSPSNEE
ncbi:THUMP domain-containing protein 1 homolog isoform X2 [Salvia hispanica]|uniref:THUMP domain-containing protein 1 homolog isoform X2 n=1 Tax=Salvia hispanica TaxID=49212 RepID=UPI002008FD8A|nr:THUMP domain-containing protein 1 homolog isoform X2 [Salvia hispanica]